MKLVLYADNSSLSSKAREFLKNHFEFEEVDADSSEGRARLRKRTQQSLVPALEIRRSHSVGVLTDFDEERWERELGLVEDKS